MSKAASGLAVNLCGVLVLSMPVLVGCDAADSVHVKSTRDSGKGLKDMNPQAIDHRGVSALLDAVGRRDIAQVRALLEAGADPDAKGVARSPLVTAITELDAKHRKLVCNFEMVRLLLDHGADPNLRDPSVDTKPLNKALELGEVKCAELLRERGASIDGLDPAGRTLLDSAVAGAVLRENMSIIDIPLSWGVDPNVRGARNWTALMTAVWLNSADAVQVLLERGVDPCIPDSRGEERIPLNIARNLKRSQAVITLLEAATHCTSGETPR